MTIRNYYKITINWQLSIEIVVQDLGLEFDDKAESYLLKYNEIDFFRKFNRQYVVAFYVLYQLSIATNINF